MRARPSVPPPVVPTSTVRAPAPAAQRREAPPPEPTMLGGESRRREDRGKPSGPPPIPPPPTHVASVVRPFASSHLAPMPDVPDKRVLGSVWYVLAFLRARWQRRTAINALSVDIHQDTAALDQVLGSLGAAARAEQLDNRGFAAENAEITAAEQRRVEFVLQADEIQSRRADEDVKFAAIEHDRLASVTTAEAALAGIAEDVERLEAQRRHVREQKKELEKKQQALRKSADDRDRQAHAISTAPNPDATAPGVSNELRKSADEHRREASTHEPQRLEFEKRLNELEGPLSVGLSKVEAARAELATARGSLNDAREGHVHRAEELDVEHRAKLRDISVTDGEIARRLVTLGTLVNLNRVDLRAFTELYERIDRIRSAIGSRSAEIDTLTAERNAYDKNTLIRGTAIIGGALVLLVAILAIIRAL